MLLKAIMPTAQAELEAREGFVPLGATIGLDGTIHTVEREIGAPVVLATKEAVAVMRGQLQREVEGGKIRAAALAADVMMWRRKDGEEASSAVSVHVEHQSGYCVDLLIPYKVRRGMMSRLRKKPQVMFRKMVAQESERVLFIHAAPVVLKPLDAGSY